MLGRNIASQRIKRIKKLQSQGYTADGIGKEMDLDIRVVRSVLWKYYRHEKNRCNKTRTATNLEQSARDMIAAGEKVSVPGALRRCPR